MSKNLVTRTNLPPQKNCLQTKRNARIKTANSTRGTIYHTRASSSSSLLLPSHACGGGCCTSSRRARRVRLRCGWWRWGMRQLLRKGRQRLKRPTVNGSRCGLQVHFKTIHCQHSAGSLGFATTQVCSSLLKETDPPSRLPSPEATPLRMSR